MTSKRKIAIVVSHPIQHFCPQYISFASNNNFTVKVYFASTLGLKKYVDLNFKQEISWGNLNLDLFEHEFLNGDAIIQTDRNIDAPSLENALSFFKPDIVITYGYFQRLQRRAHRWAKRNNVILAYISDGELRQFRSSWKALLKHFYLRSYFRNIDYFLTVGDANEAFYKRYGVPGSKLLRMHFPIDLSFYAKAWEHRHEFGNHIRIKYSIPNNEFVLSVVGKLVSWKNQDHIIEALKLLEKEEIFLHLFIIGSGEMMEVWKKEITVLTKSKVYFTGFINVEDLPSYYAATDVYIHPASIEPHSIAISEAIYMGCPVIISDRCGSYGFNDDVQIGKNGFVYKFGNIQQLTKLIVKLIKDQKLRAKFGALSHEISVKFQHQSHFGIIEDLEKILDS